MVSFSKKVKKELCEQNGKIKNCCGYAMIYGLMFCANQVDNKTVIKILNEDVGNFFIHLCQQLNIKESFDYKYDKNRISLNSDFFRCIGYDNIRKNIIKCGKCKESFLKGLFLAVGSVTDPEKSYRLELSFENAELSFGISSLLSEFGIDALETNRNGKAVLYLRKSEAIEDFFANIGATSFAFDFMNSKINKEIVNHANRVTNCDAANINKSLKASEKYNEVIEKIITSEFINMLPLHLQEMAQKRIEYKELSFAELGKLFSPPITKSGVRHRLEKIIDYYEEFNNEKLV